MPALPASGTGEAVGYRLRTSLLTLLLMALLRIQRPEHRTRAAQALCDILDGTATIFPGSGLRIHFAVQPPPRIGLAFPGSPPERSAAAASAPAS